MNNEFVNFTHYRIICAQAVISEIYISVLKLTHLGSKCSKEVEVCLKKTEPAQTLTCKHHISKRACVTFHSKPARTHVTVE